MFYSLCGVIHIDIIISAGKILAARIPARRSPPAASETKPATVGPVVHPTSPASDSRANIEVVHPGILEVARVKVHGQKIPTAKPQRMHPARPIIGDFDREIAR